MFVKIEILECHYIIGCGGKIRKNVGTSPKSSPKERTLTSRFVIVLAFSNQEIV